MNPIKKYVKSFSKKAISLSDMTGGITDVTRVGWHKFGGSYGFFKRNDMENGYPSISVIADMFAFVEPYTLNKEGAHVASNILDRLYTPNNQMDAFEFREALAVMSLVHPKVHLQVHHRTTRITGESITGFTFIEDAFEFIADGKRNYRLVTGEVLTDDEVITLKGINPYNLDEGFSPAQASRRWTKLDDYIADYQAGFFENGAVPAGELIITAPAKQDFDDIVDMLQEKHKGAGKNNNITYSHRPVDAEGNPVQTSSIEWVPFSTTNKDLALKDLFDNANKKIDSVYRVPATLRAVNDSNTYASVRVDEAIFIKYRLKPFTLKIWNKINHELNRVTGGTGVAISFRLDDPQIADEEKVKAEARKADADTVASLVKEGFTLDSAVAYVKTGDVSMLKEVPVEEENPNIQDQNEIKDTPNQPVQGLAGITMKQVAVRDMPSFYDGLEIDPAMVADPSLRGCIMLKTERLDVLNTVGAPESDLALTVSMDRSPLPGETTPHVTLLYGLLNNGNTWKDKVDAVLTDWSADKVVIDTVGYFNLPDSYAIVAHVKATTELQDAHDRLSLLPNAKTFSEYKPHMTLAYIRKEADLGLWIEKLGTAYNGKELSTDGIDYGDLPATTTATKSARVKKQIEDACKCCDGYGEHVTGFECYRCDATGIESEAVGPIPCDGHPDSPHVWQDENGTYRHIEEKRVSVQKSLSQNRRQEYEHKLADVVRTHMRTQLDHFIETVDLSKKDVKPDNPIEALEDAALADDMLRVLLAVIFAEGSIDHIDQVDLILEAGISTENVTPFEITPAQRVEFEQYVRRVATSYNQQTADRIRNVITSARENQLSVQEVKTMLAKVLDEEWRIARIAVSEINRSANLGSLYSMQNIAAQTPDAVIEKIWEHFGSDTPCPLCLAMIGKSVDLNDNFVDLGGKVIGVDGTEYTNNFVAVQTADLHPGEHCRQTYKVTRRS